MDRASNPFGIKYAFSTRHDGDMRNSQVLEQFLARKRLRADSWVQATQVHGNHIAQVTEKFQKKFIENVDGLISTGNHSITLVVRVADCIPLLFFDPRTKIIAAAHAGGRGTIGNMSGTMIHEFIRLGSKPKDIRVVIGPHIGQCCYDISNERVVQFQNVYPHEVTERNSKWYVDLGQITRRQLKELEISDENIDEVSACTSCMNTMYFSYRKDSKHTFGEQIGFISYE